MPLFGVPFAVKDNIDVAGLPTTAACPAFAYTPERDATVVRGCWRRGAILIGKTNLDQFATGLVGVRSPYGVPRNAVRRRATCRAGRAPARRSPWRQGIVSFALGTDTAGSGRVPAGFNELVGLKPTPGLLSRDGVVPACRSLDCVSVFARTAADAAAVFEVAQRAATRTIPIRAPFRTRRNCPAGRRLRVGVPAVRGVLRRRRLCGAVRAGQETAQRCSARGWCRSTSHRSRRWRRCSMADRGWPSAMRRSASSSIGIRGRCIPVTRGIIAGAADCPGDRRLSRPSTSWKRCAGGRRRSGSGIDVLLVPTAPDIPHAGRPRGRPARAEQRLGTYTNFVNLLDLAAIAVPAGRRDDGMPFGVTLIAPAMTDRALLGLAANWQGMIELAVVGAHLEGQPLHHELEGAALVRRTHTAAYYRLYALNGTQPAKPGLVRSDGGAAIEIEIYALTPERFGRFVARVPPPLAIGTVEVEDGRKVKGFVCEPSALADAADITSYGGWRAYRRATAGG